MKKEVIEQEFWIKMKVKIGIIVALYIISMLIIGAVIGNDFLVFICGAIVSIVWGMSNMRGDSSP